MENENKNLLTDTNSLNQPMAIRCNMQGTRYHVLVAGKIVTGFSATKAGGNGATTMFKLLKKNPNFLNS